MVSCISVGVFKTNKFQIGARGWHIWRRGKCVKVNWGPVEVKSGFLNDLFGPLRASLPNGLSTAPS
jgi:hypothetical protein